MFQCFKKLREKNKLERDTKHIKNVRKELAVLFHNIRSENNLGYLRRLFLKFSLITKTSSYIRPFYFDIEIEFKNGYTIQNFYAGVVHNCVYTKLALEIAKEMAKYIKKKNYFIEGGN